MAAQMTSILCGPPSIYTDVEIFASLHPISLSSPDLLAQMHLGILPRPSTATYFASIYSLK